MQLGYGGDAEDKQKGAEQYHWHCCSKNIVPRREVGNGLPSAAEKDSVEDKGEEQCGVNIKNSFVTTSLTQDVHGFPAIKNPACRIAL